MFHAARAAYREYSPPKRLRIVGSNAIFSPMGTLSPWLAKRQPRENSLTPCGFPWILRFAAADFPRPTRLRERTLS